MPPLSGVETLSLAGLAHRCTQETDLFFRRLASDPRFCFELIRRAVVGRSAAAWELVFRQYRPLVAGWIERHPAFAACNEEVQYFMNRAFERMWTALTPDKFERFPNLKSVLRYLQMCVHSVLLDHLRASREVPVADVEQELAGDPLSNGVYAPALDRLEREWFWSQIRSRLHDEKEEMVVHGSFVLGLKPGEIHRHYDGAFSGVAEIYRIKENVLARLRRDAELRAYLVGDA